MSMLAAPLVVLSLLAAEGKPTPKFPLGKDTTYITGPLDKEGYIDYVAALNDMHAKGITPENNADVLLWKALGPAPFRGRQMPAEFFKRLGIKQPSTGGAYFVGLFAYMKEYHKDDRSEFETLWGQQQRTSKQPWRAKDYPHFASWLKINEKPLAVVIEATKRSRYYSPLVPQPPEKGPGGTIHAEILGAPECRDLAYLLSCRAMLRIGEGKFEEAWQDLIACHRLARLVVHGVTVIEGLVGLSIDMTAINGDLAYLEHAKRTPEQIRECLKDLQALPAMPSVVAKIAPADRFMYLDTVQQIRRWGLRNIQGLSEGKKLNKPDADEEKILAMIDWTPALRAGNHWHDKLAAVLRASDRATRMRGFDRIGVDLGALREATSSPQELGRRILDQDLPGKSIGKVLANTLVSRMLPAAGKIQNADDHWSQQQRNLHIAFAMALYQRDHGRYPAKLNELATKYLTTVPDDLFSGKPLVYRPAEKGYLLYSVGINGIDEGGRCKDDEPPGDDVRVRMPLPELKDRK
jgi:hypothetical protein